MKPFALCFFVAALSGGVLSAGLRNKEAANKWAAFKATHAKSHPAHEDGARMARFLERDADIEAHNAKFLAGEESYSRQHSQYSDLSHEEFAKCALGFTAAVNASEIPHAEFAPSGNTPASLDWRSIMTSVKNQEYCGSCYAFAGAGALEGYIKWKTGKTLDLAEQAVVDCSYQKYNGHNNGCQGGWPSAVYQYYNEKDIMDEKQYPYTSGRSQRHGTCKFTSPVTNFLKGKLQLKNVRTRTEDEMKDIIATKGPCVVAIAADNEYQKFFTELGQGVFDNPRAIGLQPNHAVVVTGYGNYNGKDYWMIKNSWGATWADNGYGKIARGKNMCGINLFGVWFVEGL